MAEKDKFAQREHWLEEEYFGRKNQELIEKLRERRERFGISSIMTGDIDELAPLVERLAGR